MLLDYQGQDEGINHDAWVDYHDSLRPGGSPLPMPGIPCVRIKTPVVFKNHREQRFHDLIAAGCTYNQAYIDAGFDPADLPF